MWKAKKLDENSTYLLYNGIFQNQMSMTKIKYICMGSNLLKSDTTIFRLNHSSLFLIYTNKFNACKYEWKYII